MSSVQGLTDDEVRREQEKFFSGFAQKYEQMTGGATREIARHLVALAPDLSNSSVVHDNACGPAVLTDEILKKGITPKVFATDFAQGMVDHSKKLKDFNKWDSVEAELMNGQDLTFPDEKFTHSFSCFGVFMFPDSKKGVSEMYRTLKPGGWIGISSWKDVTWPTHTLAAYERLFPDAKEEFVLPRAPLWESPEEVKKLLTEVGFKNVDVQLRRCTFNHASKEVSLTTWKEMIKSFSMQARTWDDDTYDLFIEYFWESLTAEDLKDTEGGGVTMDAEAWVTYATK